MLPLLNNMCIMHCKQHWGYAVHTPAPRDRDRETELWTGSLSLILQTINHLHDALLTCKVLIKRNDLRFTMASPLFFLNHLPGQHAFPPSPHSKSSRLNFLLTVHGVVKVNFVRGEGSGCSGCACLPASNVTPDLHIFAELLENVPNSPRSG